MKNLKVYSLVFGVAVFGLLSLFSFTNQNFKSMENSEKLGLFVIVNAKPEKANDVKQFLMGALPLANQESGTKSWYAFQIDETTFGIFDTFADEDGRNAHLNGDIAKALLENADDLLVGFKVSDINKHEIIAVK
ncbi:MAG TPA: antibiotic biosynthesis monooxygenase [Saprospiraceae bacterium]|nr:antibiotic biosynthesis monooxygenase [Saprospiraceae bacterium]